MKRTDDFAVRRARIAGMSDSELRRYFWELTAKVVDPLLELGRTNTSPSVERSVLLRMGVSSPDTKAIVEGCIGRGLMGKGAGHIVYRLSLHKNIGLKEAAALLARGEAWDEAAALFKKSAADGREGRVS